ncbi:MAG: hypothetical protein U1F57_02235 [bacterium]
MKGRSILKSVLFVAVLHLLSACGGADTPFTLVDHTPDNSGGNLGPGSSGVVTPGGNSQGGCVVTYSSKFSIQAKLAPGGSSSADPTGLVVGDPHDLPPIKLHFNGNQVTMLGDDFPPADVVLGTQPITVRQKAGTQAAGTYDAATGAINLSGVQFQITQPIPIELPSFSFTTGGTGDITGANGNLSAQGAPLTSDKKLKLAAGFQIGTFPLPEYVGAAVTIVLDGTVDSIPDPATCTGGGGGASGVIFKEVIHNPDSSTSETGLGANNTLDFGGVFVAQAGTDTAATDDPHYYKTKTLRVRNNTSSALSGNLTNPAGYSITPSGSVNIPPGGSQDFQIQFGFPPASDYSEGSVPASRTVSGTLNFGSASVTLGGVAKRAAPELTMAGTETSAPNTVDLGVTPANVLGTGANTKLDCRPGSPPIPLVARKVSIQNTGIRPLQIQHILAPVNNAAQPADPYCANYGTEFMRMGLNVEGGATCQTVTVSGHVYLTDTCTIPVGPGKVNFKVVYLPANASSIRNATGNNLEKDAGHLTVQTNDPRFDGSAGHDSYSINLQGAVSPDRSNVLKIKRDGTTTEVSAGGNVRVNIPNTTDGAVTQKLVLLNHLDQPLNEVQITVADTAHFQIVNSPAPPPSVIPAMSNGAGAEPGKGEFYVRFTKPSGATTGAFPTTLQVRFIPDSTGVQNTFTVNLIGSINHQAITGRANMNIEFISSYIDSPLLSSGPVDSLDYRKPQLTAFRPGPMKMNFTAVEGSETLRNVTILNPPGVDPTDVGVLNTVRGMAKSKRAELVRVYSTRLSGYPGGVEDANHDGIPDCTDPESINQDYQAGGCSFFYYLFATKPGQPGQYDDETGQLIFSDIDLRLVNPFHAQVLDYQTNQFTNTPLRGTVSTLTVDSKYDGDISLVPDPTITNSQIAVPDSAAQSFLASAQYGCPGGDAWKPTDSATPAFGCYISHSSPYFLKGMSVTPLPDGDYQMILTLLTRFPGAGAPNYVPSFMAGGKLWVAIQGKLHICGSDQDACN